MVNQKPTVQMQLWWYLNFTIFINNPFFWFLVYFVVRETFEPLSTDCSSGNIQMKNRWCLAEDRWASAMNYGGVAGFTNKCCLGTSSDVFQNQTKQKREPRLHFWTGDQPRGRRTYIEEGMGKWTPTTNVWMLTWKKTRTPTTDVRNVERKAVIR